MGDLGAPPPADTLERISAISRALGVGGSNASVQVHLNAGGLGVIVAAGCCALMFVLSLFLLLLVFESRMHLREHGHQLNAIYRVAPSVEREVRARLEEDARLRAQASE